MKLQPREGDPVVSGTPTGQAKLCSRSGIQNTGRHFRVEAEAIGVQAANGAVGPMSDRPFCITPDSAVEDIHELEARSGCHGNGCPVSVMDQIKGYAFPPFSLIGRYLTKVRQEQVLEIVLITPIWPTQTWFPVLVSMAVRRPIQVPVMQDLLTNHKGENHPLISQGSLNLAAWLVSGDLSRQKEFQKQHQSLFLHLGEVAQKGHTLFVGADGRDGAQRGVLKPFVPL